MGLVQDEDLEWVINNDVEFFFWNKQIDQGRKNGKNWTKAILHIEVETGMIERVLRKQNEQSRRFPKKKRTCRFGLCTHYAGAESIANYYKWISKSNVLTIFISTFVRMNLNLK
jgi:alanine racemase